MLLRSGGQIGLSPLCLFVFAHHTELLDANMVKASLKKVEVTKFGSQSRDAFDWVVSFRLLASRCQWQKTLKRAEAIKNSTGGSAGMIFMN